MPHLNTGQSMGWPVPLDLGSLGQTSEWGHDTLPLRNVAFKTQRKIASGGDTGSTRTGHCATQTPPGLKGLHPSGRPSVQPSLEEIQPKSNEWLIQRHKGRVLLFHLTAALSVQPTPELLQGLAKVFVGTVSQPSFSRRHPSFSFCVLTPGHTMNSLPTYVHLRVFPRGQERCHREGRKEDA